MYIYLQRQRCGSLRNRREGVSFYVVYGILGHVTLLFNVVYKPYIILNKSNYYTGGVGLLLRFEMPKMSYRFWIKIGMCVANSIHFLRHTNFLELVVN